MVFSIYTNFLEIDLSILPRFAIVLFFHTNFASPTNQIHHRKFVQGWKRTVLRVLSLSAARSDRVADILLVLHMKAVDDLCWTGLMREVNTHGNDTVVKHRHRRMNWASCANVEKVYQLKMHASPS